MSCRSRIWLPCCQNWGPHSAYSIHRWNDPFKYQPVRVLGLFSPLSKGFVWIYVGYLLISFFNSLFLGPATIQPSTYVLPKLVCNWGVLNTSQLKVESGGSHNPVSNKELLYNFGDTLERTCRVISRTRSPALVSASISPGSAPAPWCGLAIFWNWEHPIVRPSRLHNHGDLTIRWFFQHHNWDNSWIFEKSPGVLHMSYSML